MRYKNLLQAGEELKIDHIPAALVKRLASDFDRGGSLSLHCKFQTDFGAHPAFYPMGKGAFYPVLKLSVREANQSTPSSVDEINERHFISGPPKVFVAWCLGIGDYFFISSISIFLLS
jgi:hypothetical protein